MKKTLLITALCLSLLPTAIAGEFDKTVDPFTSVIATGNFAVIMIESTEEKVHVSNKDTEITDDRILVTVTGGTLDLRIKNDVVRDKPIEITVHYKKIYQIESKKDCKVTVSNVLKGDLFTLICTTGGKIKAEVELSTLKVNISNGGTVNIGGTATTAEYTISTGGTIAAINTKTETTSAKISMLGDINCAVSTKLSVKITSGGTVTYRGNPASFDEKITLGGTVTKLAD